MSEFIGWAIMGLVIIWPVWFFTRHWSSEDKGMLILWIIAMVGIGYIVGWENVSIGFPQGR
jgi:hypothetical protein